MYHWRITHIDSGEVWEFSALRPLSEPEAYAKGRIYFGCGLLHAEPIIYGKHS